MLISYLTPSVIGIVHLITIGFFLNTIVGSLSQMLPVLAGVSLKRPVIFSQLVYWILNLGALSFVTGLIFQLNSAILAGVVLLTISYLFFFLTIARLVFQPNTINPTMIGFRLTVIFALMGLLVGALLGVNYIVDLNIVHRLLMLRLHYDMMLMGVIFTLIVAVCFKIIPMFYVTNEYPPWLKVLLLPTIAFLLLIETLMALPIIPSIGWLEAIYPLLYFVPLTLFAIITIIRIYQRRRPVRDTTVYYWYLAMLLLIVAMLLIGYNQLYPTIYLSQYLAIIVGPGVILSVMLGMLYKILPFLAWFHLTAHGVIRAPTMRALLPSKVTNIQLLTHIVGILLLLIAIRWPQLLILGAAMLAISQLIHLVIISQIIRKYHHLKN